VTFRVFPLRFRNQLGIFFLGSRIFCDFHYIWPNNLCGPKGWSLPLGQRLDVDEDVDVDEDGDGV